MESNSQEGITRLRRNKMFSHFYFVTESHTVPVSGEEGLEDVGDELHEEIDLDDDEEDEVAIVEASQPQEQQQQSEGK